MYLLYWCKFNFYYTSVKKLWISNATTQGLFVSGVDSFDKNYRYVN
jgi:hypothetical protein